MRYVDEFRNGKFAKKLVEEIKNVSKKKIKLMEVCGTHTVAIFKYGLSQLMPENITLLSGPGCPVCVTPNETIDKAIWLVKQRGVILTTFGDMVKVPGSSSSLSQEKSEGYDVRIVYSTMDALKIAQNNLAKKVLFFAIGFETTAPTIAASILEAKRLKLTNYYILADHKLIPPAMKALLDTKELSLDGFICPGHVSTIIGAEPYEFIIKDYRIPCVITGFEPLDILQAILMLVKQIEDNKPKVEIQYKRAVKYEGNPSALNRLYEVLEETDSNWRGIGVIPNSGLRLREKYRDFDIENIFEIKQEKTKYVSGCLCGEVLRGVRIPTECKYFGKLCTPENPVGACMVSIEGACSAYYKYRGKA